MPKVSVIIPSYNHARYLPQRLDSVLGQSFEDFEVLFLDDASPDDSRAVFEAHAASTDPRVRAIFNETNSGSTFKQWNRGFRETTGEYVWIAESDDYADPSLLAELVTRMDNHPSVGLAYCESQGVDQDGTILCRAMTGLASPDRRRWESDFVNNGRDECTRYLVHKNCIVNASAVLIRRSVFDQIAPAPEDFRLVGDWLVYMRLLLKADVAFVAKPLNYFRTHTSTVRSNTGKHGYWLEESIRLKNQIAREAGLSREIRLDLVRDFAWHWSGIQDGPSDSPIPWRTQLRIFRELMALDPRAISVLAFVHLSRSLQRFGLLAAARSIKRALTFGTRGVIR